MIGLIGQSVLDRTFWPDGRIEERLGGSPRFAASAVTGVCPAVVVTQGGDRSLRRPLHELGLEVIEGPARATTVFEVSLYGDGRWAESIVAFGQAFTVRDVRTWMARGLLPCSSLVLGSQWRDDFPLPTLAALAAGGARMFLDGQGYVRPRRLGPIHLESGLDWRTLSHVDVLKLSEEEADVLLGGADPAAVLAPCPPVVVVTLGERGAIVYVEGETVAVGVEPVIGLTDTVGAGDSFLALMASAMEAGADPIEATKDACDRVASLLRARLAAEQAIAVQPARDPLVA